MGPGVSTAQPRRPRRVVSGGVCRVPEAEPRPRGPAVRYFHQILTPSPAGRPLLAVDAFHPSSSAVSPAGFQPSEGGVEIGDGGGVLAAGKGCGLIPVDPVTHSGEAVLDERPVGFPRVGALSERSVLPFDFQAFPHGPAPGGVPAP